MITKIIINEKEYVLLEHVIEWDKVQNLHYGHDNKIITVPISIVNNEDLLRSFILEEENIEY